MTAIDHDEGPNGEIGYSLVGDEAEGLFQIHRRTGEITVRRRLTAADHQTERLLVVEATDHGKYRGHLYVEKLKICLMFSKGNIHRRFA